MSLSNDILNKFNLKPDNIDIFNILVASLREILKFYKEIKLKNIQDKDIPLLSYLKTLNDNEIEYLEKEIQQNEISIEECQIKVQKKIPQNERKKLAAYYTTDEGINLMASLVEEYIKKNKNKQFVIADPFFGSGRTLTETVKRIGINNIKKIWGIEPYTLSALVGYAALLKVVKGRRSLIKIISGDAFTEISKEILIKNNKERLNADIILTNPPFTRWKYMDNNYRNTLLKLFDGLGYSKFITRKETSLQILSMFLVDYILKKNGLLISVLPASTFYTIYGRGYKELIKEKYFLLSFLESGSQASFSIDSGFKEVIIIGLKKKEIDGLTIFTQINGVNIQDFAFHLLNSNIEYFKQKDEFYLVNVKNLAQFLDNNWLSLVGNKKLKELVIEVFNQGISTGILGFWKDILGIETLIRGIEMYGPDFFFLRNKYWDICKDVKNHIEIENKETKESLIIDKKYLIKTLRKPSLYSYTINPAVDTYMISIPPEEVETFPENLRAYINWGKSAKTAEPAIRKHRKYWYSHVYYQVQSKKPFGNIFITDKVDLNFINRGIFANFSEIELAASKNFYIIRNINSKYSILLTAWFNSTIFISILILFSRKISDTWTRFLINDYLEVPILNMVKISDDLYKEISVNLINILNEKLLPFWEQIGKRYRYDLDLTISKALKIENPTNFIKELYNSLKDYLNSIKR